MLWWIRRQLHSQDPQTRTRAVAKLAESRNAQALELLVAALRDDIGVVRAGAARALKVRAQEFGKAGHSAALEPLVGALRDVESTVRAKAAAALGVLEDRRSLEPLANVLNDPSAEVRQCAVAALGSLKASPATPHLASALSDPVPAVRCAAAHALGSTAREDAVEPLAVAAADADKEVRAQVVSALAEIGGGRAAEALADALADPDDDVRRRADFGLLSIGQKGDKEAQRALVRRARDRIATAASGYRLSDSDRDAALAAAALTALAAAPADAHVVPIEHERCAVCESTIDIEAADGPAEVPAADFRLLLHAGYDPVESGRLAAARRRASETAQRVSETGGSQGLRELAGWGIEAASNYSMWKALALASEEPRLMCSACMKDAERFLNTGRPRG